MKKIFHYSIISAWLFFTNACSIEDSLSEDMIEEDAIEHKASTKDSRKPSHSSDIGGSSTRQTVSSSGNNQNGDGPASHAATTSDQQGQGDAPLPPTSNIGETTTQASKKNSPADSGDSLELPNVTKPRFTLDDSSSETIGTNGQSSGQETRGKLGKDHTSKTDVRGWALQSKKPSTRSISDPKKDTTIVGKEGTEVTIPANSLVFEDGTSCESPVTVKLWEFYNLPDIMLAGLSTNSDEGLLQTGGMIYLEAEAKGSPLTLRAGERITLDFNPTLPVDSEFDLFHGVKEKNRIGWKRAKDAKIPEGSRDKGSIMRVNMFDASDSGNSKTEVSESKFLERFFSFVFDTEAPENTVAVRDFSSPRSLDGLGTATFSNGTKVFFNGALEVINYYNTESAAYQRYAKEDIETSPSFLSLKLEKGFFAAKVPFQHSRSSFKLILDDQTHLNPTIRPVATRGGCFFILNEHLSEAGSLLPELRNTSFKNWQNRIGDNHAVRCLQGKLEAKSPKHYLNLDARAGRRFGILSPDENPSVGVLHGKGPKEDDFAEQIVRSMTAKIKTRVDGAEQVSQKALGLAQNDMRRFIRPNNNGNVIDTRITKHLAPLGDALETLRDSRDLNTVLTSAAEQINEPETLNLCSNLEKRLDSSIGEIESWLDENGGADGEAIIAKAQAISAFSSEFLSPQLGWHNLDKLKRSRSGMDSYDLSSSFSFDSSTRESAEEESPNTSFGPFYYAVWPNDGISSNAFVGANSIPKGDFQAVGFAVDRNGEIFADFQNARTGDEVELDLQAIDRELFRKTVAGWK
tara:strand:- start:4516 stop:6921 length:2406 start_codon:yes stop_codon:yes gene_type:complete